MNSSNVFKNGVGSFLLSLPFNLNLKGYLKRIGQTLNIADYPKLASELNGMFNTDMWYVASTTTIVNMTSNILPSGYTAQSIIGTAYTGFTGKEFQAFDRNVGTDMEYSGGYGCLELTHPATVISGIELESGSGASYAYMPTSGKIMQSVDGTNFIQTCLFENFSAWTASLKRALTIDKILKTVKTRLYWFGNLNGLVMTSVGNLNIYPYGDLSQFSIPSDEFITGDECYITSAINELPTELQTHSTYFARRISAGVFQWHPTANDATNNTNKVTPTTTGGALKVAKKGKFKLDDTRSGNYVNFIKF